MSSFTGTWRLTRLAFRRDRVKMPLWIIAIAGLMLASVPALGEVYSDQAARVTYAQTSASSVAARVFGGTVDGATLGAITMVETFLFTAVLIAFMSTLSIVRHTRQNEELGRSELIGSMPVGRYSEMLAAILVTLFANFVTACLLFLSLLVEPELSKTGSLGLSVTFFCIGISFMGVAALTSQLSESSRGANSMAAIAIGVFFVIRGIGDAFGDVADNGLRVVSEWPTWLSPFGWGQLIHPFTQGNWAILGLFGGFSLIVFSVSAYLLRIRDNGRGILSARTGPAHAKKSLLSPLGLSWRLQRGILIGWSIVALSLGLTFGSIADEFSDMLESNQEFAEVIGALGGSENITNVFFGAMFGFTALIIAGYSLQALLKARTEESTNRLEAILGSNVSRHEWLGSHVAVILFGIAKILLILGFSSAVTYFLVSGSDWGAVWTIGLAPLVQLPAIAALFGFGIFLFGAAPRWLIAGVWSLFAAFLVIGQFGVLLKLPSWVINLSPFSHLPTLPSESLELLPVSILSLIALCLLVGGFVLFRRRDIQV